MPDATETRVGVHRNCVINGDQRRTISLVFDNRVEGFDGAQETTVIGIHEQGAVLGDHFHSFAELFLVVSGEVEFFVECVDSPRGVERFTLRGNDRILIPARVAHTVRTLSSSATLVACLERPFESPTPHKVPLT